MVSSCNLVATEVGAPRVYWKRHGDTHVVPVVVLVVVTTVVFELPFVWEIFVPEWRALQLVNAFKLEAWCASISIGPVEVEELRIWVNTDDEDGDGDDSLESCGRRSGADELCLLQRRGLSQSSWLHSVPLESPPTESRVLPLELSVVIENREFSWLDSRSLLMQTRFIAVETLDSSSCPRARRFFLPWTIATGRCSSLGLEP